ncbi:MAG: hypothetical protein RBR35_00740 [Salinivirgaceae bacterium]|nr:hypothetical protein [Salinivirgaceae bacterium]
MKKLIFATVLLMGLSVFASAQNQLGKSDDLARISLTPIVPDELDNIPAAARKLLTNKLSLVAAKNGLSGSATNPRFVITANIDVLTKEITPTTPAKTALTLSVTFYIADVVAQTVFASTSIDVKGVGDNETKAYMSAVGRIAPLNPSIRAMIEQGKEKIVEYYNSQCDFILKDAQAKADMRAYEHALYILTSVPSICKECYDKAMTMVPTIYQQHLDLKCMEDVTKAKAFWGQKDYDNALKHLAEILPDSKCYEEASALYKKIEQEECYQALGAAKGAWASLDPILAAEHLSQVSASCDCYPEAEKLQKEIQTKVTADQKREWDRKIVKEDRTFDLQEKKLNSETEIAKARLEAASSIASVAVENNAAGWGYYNNLMWIFGH